MGAQTTFTEEELQTLREKGIQALKNNDLVEAEKILKIMPLAPVAAKTYQFLYGKDYLEKEGYNISQLKFNPETGYVIV